MTSLSPLSSSTASVQRMPPSNDFHLLSHRLGVLTDYVLGLFLRVNNDEIVCIITNGVVAPQDV